MSSVRVRLRIERHIRENAQDCPRRAALFHADISALIRCTVPVPTPTVVAILRIPLSPFFSAFRIAASVAVLIAGGRAEMWPL